MGIEVLIEFHENILSSLSVLECVGDNTNTQQKILKFTVGVVTNSVVSVRW